MWHFEFVIPPARFIRFQRHDASPTSFTAEKPEISQRMQQRLLEWNESVKASVAGKDYPAGNVYASEPPTRSWISSPEYEKILPQLKDRPEYRAAVKKGR